MRSLQKAMDSMKPELFDELMQSMRELLEHAQGKRALKTTTLPGRPRQVSPEGGRVSCSAGLGETTAPPKPRRSRAVAKKGSAKKRTSRPKR